MHTRTSPPDYFIAQFPGGGQRGYATVKLLEWFEKQTGLPTHQLFPYITCGSVGILIASALYLPHPTEKNAARLSAAQLLDVFPEIASRTPKKAALFKNTNSREPLGDMIRLFVGDARLKDFLGTIFFSSHVIGGGGKSHKTYAKIISPYEDKTAYKGDPDTRVVDIAFAGTALPSIFPAYDGHIDLAFSEVYADSLQEIRNLFPPTTRGGFVRVGNFRGTSPTLIKKLHSSGYLIQPRALFDAIADHAYAQTFHFVEAAFRDFVFNLEQEIDVHDKKMPDIQANITSPEQFKKIDALMDTYISQNSARLEWLADQLSVLARERMLNFPHTAFDIPPHIQEFTMPEIPKANKEHDTTMAYDFRMAASKLCHTTGAWTFYTVQKIFESAVRAAINPTTRALAKQAKLTLDGAIIKTQKTLLPDIQIHTGGAHSPVKNNHEPL